MGDRGRWAKLGAGTLVVSTINKVKKNRNKTQHPFLLMMTFISEVPRDVVLFSIYSLGCKMNSSGFHWVLSNVSEAIMGFFYS